MNYNRVAYAAAGAVAAIAIGFGLALLNGPVATQPESGSVPTMNSATEAISASLGLFPDSTIPLTTTARLVPLSTIVQWSGVLDGGDFELSTPAWLVGIVADSLTVRDIVSVGPIESADNTPVVGAYYAWTTNSAELIVLGSIPSQADYDALIALQNQPLLIVTASPLPPWPTVDPTYMPPEVRP